MLADIMDDDALMAEIDDRAEQNQGSAESLWDVVREYLQFKSPEMLKDNGGEIDFNPEPATAPAVEPAEPVAAPAAEPAAAPAPAEPVPQQEGWQSGLEQRLGKIKSLAEQSGRDFDSINLSINGKDYSLSEALSAFNLAEKKEEEPPFDPDPPKKNPSAVAGKYGQGYSTARHLARQGQAQAQKKSLAKEIQEMVKSFTNLVPERMDQGPFPLGEEGVITKVTKDMCEKFGKEDDERFKMAVETYCRETVGKLSSVYETSRMKKLAGMDSGIDESSQVPYQVKMGPTPMAITSPKPTAIVASKKWTAITPDIEAKATAQGFRKVMLKVNGQLVPGLEGGDQVLGSKIIVAPSDFENMTRTGDAGTARRPMGVQSAEKTGIGAPPSGFTKEEGLSAIKKLAGLQ
jgi:hypothetical protein